MTQVTIDVRYDEDLKEFRCNEFGVVHSWKPGLQHTHNLGGASRPCVHRDEPMPRTQLFGTDWVRSLCWQLVLTDGQYPVMACRKQDLVTIAFDRIGPVLGCTNKPNGQKPENRWQYRLYPIHWWDIGDANNVLLGVWPD
jgi:hypothetical protein